MKTIKLNKAQLNRLSEILEILSLVLLGSMVIPALFTNIPVPVIITGCVGAFVTFVVSIYLLK